MSAYTYQTDTQPQVPYLQSTPQDDVKASFDDLVDPYTSPFAPNSRHQTFVVGTPLKQQPSPPSHQREPSVPLSTKAYSLKQSEDTHETSYNYPPALPQKEVVETQSAWKRVCILFSILHIDQYYCIAQLVPESIPCRLYLATVLLETAIDLAIEGELYSRVREKIKEDQAILHNTNIATSRMPVYLSVFALAQ